MKNHHSCRSLFKVFPVILLVAILQIQVRGQGVDLSRLSTSGQVEFSLSDEGSYILKVRIGIRRIDHR